MGSEKGSPNWETTILRIQGRSFIQDIDELAESLKIPFSVIPAQYPVVGSNRQVLGKLRP
jgi:hypothetical protein